MSVRIDGLLPNAETIERWRDADVVPEVTEWIRQFLKTHAAATATV